MILMWLMIKTWNKLIVSLMRERPSLVYILSHDFELLLEGTCIPPGYQHKFHKITLYLSQQAFLVVYSQSLFLAMFLCYSSKHYSW